MDALVVEDDSHTRALIAAVLGEQGVAVTSFADGERALTHFTRFPVPMVVLDWVMPGLDGLEVCRRIRALPNGDTVFVLVITGRSSTTDMTAVLAAGANDYISKPLDLALLTVRLAVAKEQAMQLMARRAAELALRSTERQVRALLASAPLALLGIDADGHVAIAEGKIIHDVFNVDAVIGTPFSELTDDATLLASIAAGTEERYVVHREGRDYELRTTTDPEAPGRVTIVAVDVTEHQRLERELEAALAHAERAYGDTQAVLDQLGVGMAVIDEADTLTFANRAAVDYLRLESSQAVVGRHWQEVLHFSDHGVTIARLLATPNDERRAAPVTLTYTDRTLHFKLEVLDDPRDPERRILTFYDTTEVFDLRKMLQGESTFHGLVGSSEAMIEVHNQIREAGAVDWTAMIEGDTGTGKELVARAIHAESPRSSGPFVAVNCAGLSVSLLQSQLFGHRKGAFTGAVRDQPGYFESAHGGTLFLDEIGDIAPEVQTSLLRVLEDRTVTRLGDSHPRQIDVRVVVATHRDLAQRVADGHFRADLLYRIRVVRVRLSPLRERTEDIPLLVSTFLSRANAMTGKHLYGVSQEAMSALMRHSWPGNVRELKASIEYASTRCRSEWVELADLPPELQEGPRRPEGQRPYSPRDNERECIISALEEARGNRTRAARQLGMSRATFYRRLSQLDIDPDTLVFRRS